MVDDEDTVVHRPPNETDDPFPPPPEIGVIAGARQSGCLFDDEPGQRSAAAVCDETVDILESWVTFVEFTGRLVGPLPRVGPSPRHLEHQRVWVPAWPPVESRSRLP